MGCWDVLWDVLWDVFVTKSNSSSLESSMYDGNYTPSTALRLVLLHTAAATLPDTSAVSLGRTAIQNALVVTALSTGHVHETDKSGSHSFLPATNVIREYNITLK